MLRCLRLTILLLIVCFNIKTFCLLFTAFSICRTVFNKAEKKSLSFFYLPPLGCTTIIGGCPGIGIGLPIGPRVPGGQVPDKTNIIANNNFEIFFFIFFSDLICDSKITAVKNICQDPPCIDFV